ncbi:MAG TPA: NHL repeat-containing protein [Methanocella sp.]
MRRSNVILVLALTALAVIFFTMVAQAYVPRYSPTEIAVDNGGNVYTIMFIESSTGEGIFAYAANGTEIISIRRPRCSDVAIDSHGIVYVINLAQKQVERLEKNGTFSVVWRDDNPDHFINYFTTDRDDNILVSDFNYSQAEIKVTDGWILKISPEGKVLDTIGSSPAVSLNKPFRMSASNNGSIYLTNFSRCFSVIYPDGNGSTIIPTGNDNGTFNQVVTVEAGYDGYLYIGEMTNGSVQKLAEDGTLVAKWDGCGPDRFLTPTSIVACRDGRVYVSDMRNQRIVWFDSTRNSFGENFTDNIAGKGVLWDNVIAGDNNSNSFRYQEQDGGGKIVTPGFGVEFTMAGICLAGAVLCLSRIRKN